MRILELDIIEHFQSKNRVFWCFLNDMELFIVGIGIVTVCVCVHSDQYQVV